MLCCVVCDVMCDVMYVSGLVMLELCVEVE